MSATACSVLKLSFCTETASGSCIVIHYCSLIRSILRCRIYHNVEQLVHRMQDGVSHTQFAAAIESSRLALCSRQVAVMPDFSFKIAGRVTKYCHTFTIVENPSPRNTCPELLNSHKVLRLRTARNRFRNAQSNKSGCSCLVSFVTRSCEILRYHIIAAP